MNKVLTLIFIFVNTNFSLSCQNGFSDFEQINVIYGACHSVLEDCKEDPGYWMLKKNHPYDSIKFSFTPNFTDSLDISLNDTIIYSARVQVNLQREIKFLIPANKVNSNGVVKIKLILNDRRKFARLEIPGFYMKVTIAPYLNEPIYEKYGLNHKEESFVVNLDNHRTVHR